MSDFLLRDARLVDLDGGGTADRPVDVRIVEGIVAEVAPRLPAEGLPEVAADGRWLMPGLWDQHVHLTQWSLTAARLDLARARSAEQAVTAVRERLAAWPDLPVIGWGHRPTDWPEEPLVSMLDAIDTDQPIVLIAGDGHHGWLNSVALMTFALPSREGVVSEREWFAAYARLATLPGDAGTGPDAILRTQEQAAALGVVGVTDLEFSGGPDAWIDRWGAGAGLLRVRAATYADGLDAVIERGLRTGDPLPGCDDRARMGPLKIISDGSLNTRTAWCCDPYAGPAPLGFPQGQPNQTPEELRHLLRRAADHGLDVAVHAIGDRAVSEALDAIADTGARGSIEHAQLVRRDDVRRMAELGVTASVQPAHLVDDRDATDRLWPGRGERCFAFRWMLDDGVTLALGSDAPVAALDPWLAVAAAVHRTVDGREPWYVEQAITLREALSASTDGRGTVGTGHPADLVLLDDDPLGSWAGRLPAPAVAATWVGGRLVHGDL
ncbi:amidohydrolase [Nocardioides sp.]|uniref:amidohydrolase n=1 Tax=Nocardioides sp. TaxID=35761 RepID=UPI002ED52D12